MSIVLPCFFLYIVVSRLLSVLTASGVTSYIIYACRLSARSGRVLRVLCVPGALLLSDRLRMIYIELSGVVLSTSDGYIIE